MSDESESFTIEVKNDYMLGRQNENILYYKCMELEQENIQLKGKLKEVKKILLCGFDTQATIFKALEILGDKENE